MNAIRCILLVLVSIQLGYGQVMTFLVSDKETDMPIEGAEIFSNRRHDKIVYTNKEGYAQYEVRQTDTLVFLKLNYAPFYMHIRNTNFDSAHHFIQVKMMSSNTVASIQFPAPINSLSQQHYTFAHDSLQDNKLEITQFLESQAALPKDASFHLIDVQINKESNRRKGYSRK